MQDLQQWIKSCEELKLETYVDTTGHLTIGWGHNLADGITQEMAEFIFQCDFKQTLSDLERFAWFNAQPQGVKNALINMNFNLGITKMLEFKDMIHCLQCYDYTGAALAALNSEWAKEVHGRATDIALMIREGK